MNAELIKKTDVFLDDVEEFFPEIVCVVIAKPDGQLKVKGHSVLADLIYKGLGSKPNPQVN